MLVIAYPTLQRCCSHREHFLLGKLEINWKSVTLNFTQNGMSEN